MQDLTLIVGASGQVSSEIIKILKAKGIPVRGTTSQKTKVNSETAYLNVVTGEGLKEAFQGVSKAFLITPPGYADQYATLSPLIQEAKRRGLKKVVLMTAMGADAAETAPFRRAELELEKSGLTYNIIRPNWFMQNFASFWVQPIREMGKILLPAGTAQTSFIHSKDISAVASELLLNSKFDNQAFDLTGPEALDHSEVAAEISEVTGKKVIYEEISAESFRQALLKAGLPADYTDFLVMIMGFLREGYSARITGSVEKITGRKPLTFESYAREGRKSWL